MEQLDISMTVASCHCGQVKIEVAGLPSTVTECNCSICRRYAALWAYTRRREVRLNAAPGSLARYSWGDRSIEFCHCTRCGCLTHYESIEKHDDSRFAVNARMLPPELQSGLTVRRFDGADTWAYLD